MSDIDVFITQDAHNYLREYILATHDEIGGFGFARRYEDGTFHWVDTFVVPQEVSQGSVDIMGDGLAFAVEQAVEHGVMGDPDFVWVKWHSHNTMGAYFSLTDDKARDEMRASGAPMVLDYVGNHKGEYVMRLDLYDHPLFDHISLDAKLLVDRPAYVKADVHEQVKKHVKKRQWFTSPKPKAPQSPAQRDEQAGAPMLSPEDLQAWFSDWQDWDDDDCQSMFGMDRAEIAQMIGEEIVDGHIVPEAAFDHHHQQLMERNGA